MYTICKRKVFTGYGDKFSFQNKNGSKSRLRKNEARMERTRRRIWKQAMHETAVMAQAGVDPDDIDIAIDERDAYWN